VTAMRSDAAPAVQKGTNAQFGLVEGDGTTIDCSVTPGICIAKINGILPTPVRAGDIIYWNGSQWVTLAGNNSGTQILAENSSGVPSWSAAGSGSVTSVACDGITITVTGTCPPRFDFVNISITASVAGNNLTIAVKDNTGADCSATSPCSVWYRDFTTAANGKWAKVDTTAALSFTANAGSTFGVANSATFCLAASSCPFKLWIVMMNSGSGNVIGVADLTSIAGVNTGALSEASVKSSTACSACATATALATIYSTAAQTSVAIKIIGYCEWGSGLGTAGTYASAPTSCQTLGPGVKRPGEVVQSLNATVANSPTNPTSTTYSTALSRAITPTLASNLIRIRGAGSSTVTAGLSSGATAIMNGTTIVGVTQRLSNSGSGNVITTAAQMSYDLPGSTSSQTYNWKVRGDGTNVGGLCASSLATDGCSLDVEEIQGALPEVVPDSDNDPRLLNKVG